MGNLEPFGTERSQQYSDANSVFTGRNLPSFVKDFLMKRYIDFDGNLNSQGNMGLVGNMSIVDNMMLRSYRKGNSIFVNRKKPKALADKIIDGSQGRGTVRGGVSEI